VFVVLVRIIYLHGAEMGMTYLLQKCFFMKHV
jgi:hypothetical protein